jgi:hypothetical protein
MKLLKQHEICRQALPPLIGADASTTRFVSV